MTKRERIERALRELIITKRKAERAVIDTAMYEYRRLRKLGYNRLTYGGTAQKHWDACAALHKQRSVRKP